MDPYTQAFIIAAIDIKVEQEKKEAEHQEAAAQEAEQQEEKQQSEDGAVIEKQ